MKSSGLETSRAETVALEALGFLAAADALGRFMAASGADIDVIRARAGDPEFLAAVMDFLLGDDALVTDFCAQQELDSAALHRLRRALPGAAPA
ncbi:MAG: DUF3572 family protein [Alphaproteobacteria bacterium]|nr:DUF3572 family protein [Alphaproteobacteria bacterium]MDE2012566.1 DUF3572 domain-containing protein [Alphaproteobacteria bacterium]MDE2073431.1 DUF3572 domain-containing protein [Alphaproteobacteria bacterium]MDE2350953.1 DUF3572 domain-containing protein [Alphaproteobacteria bacterium]